MGAFGFMRYPRKFFNNNIKHHQSASGPQARICFFCETKRHKRVLLFQAGVEPSSPTKTTATCWAIGCPAIQRFIIIIPIKLAIVGCGISHFWTDWYVCIIYIYINLYLSRERGIPKAQSQKQQRSESYKNPRQMACNIFLCIITIGALLP